MRCPTVRQADTLTHLTTWDFPNPLRMFLDILLPATSGVSCADELGVVLESWWYGLATVSVALYEFDDLGLFLAHSPLMKGREISKDEGVTIVRVARAIRGF
jgi:hypothetical protein